MSVSEDDEKKITLKYIWLANVWGKSQILANGAISVVSVSLTHFLQKMLVVVGKSAKPTQV